MSGRTTAGATPGRRPKTVYSKPGRCAQRCDRTHRAAASPACRTRNALVTLCRHPSEVSRPIA
jgi:hypothetical protein